MLKQATLRVRWCHQTRKAIALIASYLKPELLRKELPTIVQL
jgi:hypothetical protein